MEISLFSLRTVPSIPCQTVDPLQHHSLYRDLFLEEFFPIERRYQFITPLMGYDFLALF